MAFKRLILAPRSSLGLSSHIQLPETRILTSNVDIAFKIILLKRKDLNHRLERTAQDDSL